MLEIPETAGDEKEGYRDDDGVSKIHEKRLPCGLDDAVSIDLPKDVDHENGLSGNGQGVSVVMIIFAYKQHVDGGDDHELTGNKDLYEETLG